MRTTIDGAGRVVVPKALRDQLGLESGTPLDVQVRDGRLEIEPVPTSMHLERRGKGFVAVPDDPLPPIDAADVRAVIEAMRR
jgi:AbrB family looped-hinge helix DNA binding protein